MSNKEIYRKTLGFSLRRVLWDILALLILGACVGGGFLVAEKMLDKGLIGLGAGALVGLIVIAFLLRYVSYTYKAGQIAMMTKGITEGSLPDDVIGEGKRTVKERFLTVAAFFAVTSVIKGIFNQVGNAINSVGRSLGGEKGNQVANVISLAIQVLVSYLCDCCLGWVFYRKEQKSVRATLEGAVLFFKHGKTLAKNMGRIYGMGLLSFAAIGGVFTAAFYAVFRNFPVAFQKLAQEIAEAASRGQTEIPAFLTDPAMLTVAAAVVAAVIIWSILHSVFVRPFVLTGVLRNYIEAGIKDIPTEASFAELDKKSAKFRKLHAKLA